MVATSLLLIVIPAAATLAVAVNPVAVIDATCKFAYALTVTAVTFAVFAV